MTRYRMVTVLLDRRLCVSRALFGDTHWYGKAVVGVL